MRAFPNRFDAVSMYQGCAFVAMTGRNPPFSRAAEWE
jgi:hypothetical protein